MRVFNTAVVIEHNGDYILNFDNYDSDQWSIILDILDQLFKQNYGTRYFHQNRLTLTMESLVNDQILLKLAYGENEIYTSKIMPEFELVLKLITAAKHYYYTLAVLNICSKDKIDMLFTSLDTAFTKRYES
ncbi:hypothetical protein GCM10008018_10750 [Paenibacillus marchantiophytorum]|uniref:Uncharacterized protein n=2 Tax=Paenibacillus marchantiophytorum TaxID=1619310 RepID=A0ABQ2BSD7_9BACL|nr:hypothetical protein GCM10008018_10750 [Paenibacillus marchantiophytorum]